MIDVTDSLKRDLVAKLLVRNKTQTTAFRGLVQQYQELLQREQMMTERVAAMEREYTQMRQESD
jgi:hypothetical protein